MNSNILTRLLAMEYAAKANLPPVLCLNGTYGSPRLWNIGTTRERAEAINACTESLLEMLNSPAPDRMIEDYE